MEESNLPLALNGKSIGVRVTAVIIGVGVLALSAKIVFVALSAGLGIVALGGLGFVSLAAWKSIPLMAQKFDNFLLSEQKKEARDMPIEQMQNGIAEMKQEAMRLRNQIKIDAGNIKNYQSKLKDLRKKYPDHDYADMEVKIKTAIESVESKAGKFNQTAAEISKLEKDLELYKAELELAEIQLVGTEDAQSLRSSEKRRLLMNESFEAIRSRIDQGFAGMLVESNGALAAIPHTKIGSNTEIDYQPDEKLEIELNFDFDKVKEVHK